MDTADLDRDGRPELIGLMTDGPSLAWWRLSDATSTTTSQVIDAAGPTTPAIGDLDGDGDLDLVGNHGTTNGEVQVLF